MSSQNPNGAARDLHMRTALHHAALAGASSPDSDAKIQQTHPPRASHVHFMFIAAPPWPSMRNKKQLLGRSFKQSSAACKAAHDCVEMIWSACCPSSFSDLATPDDNFQYWYYCGWTRSCTT